MDHHALIRPKLPGSTPSPAPLGKTSVYASRIPPHLMNSINKSSSKKSIESTNIGTTFVTEEPISPTLNNDTQFPIIEEKKYSRTLQEKTLFKLVSKLPFEMRESVNSVLTMAFNAAESVQKDLELSRKETVALRDELNKKTVDIQNILKSCGAYKEQIRGLEENIESLQDNIDSRQRFSIKNRSAMTRLAATNRMLIDALDALQTVPTPSVLYGRTMGHNKPASPSNSDANLVRQGLLAPLSSRTPRGINHKEYEEKVQQMTMSQNDKLRESLLKISREHYRSMKNSEHLETKCAELRTALRTQEQLNRKLKTQIDELKAIHIVDDEANEELKSSDVASNYKANSIKYIDSRLQNLIDRNLFDPIDGIQQLKSMLSHMSMAPNNLNLYEMIQHIVCKETLKIFSSDMVCLYLVKPGLENMLHKFTTRQIEPEVFDMSLSKSLAAETFQFGKINRVNSLAKSVVYNPEIDGCIGIVTKRILSLPLYNSQTNMVIGVIQYINKGYTSNEAFAEIDEIFGMIFAYQISLLLTSCVMYESIFYHAQLLRGLLESSTDLYSILPDSEASKLSNAKVLTTGEILYVLEVTARELLKCPGVRVFLLSDFVGTESNKLIYLDSKLNGTNRFPILESVLSTQLTGIAGFVLKSKVPYLMEQSSFDSYINPTIDLDPLEFSMLTVPIIDLQGEVLGCIELLIGNRSPRLKHSTDPHDFRLLFSEAASWFTHQIAPPLKYLLNQVNKKAYRPSTTPSKISRNSMDAKYRPSFFSASEEVVSQILSNINENINENNDKFKSFSLASVPSTRSFPLPPPDPEDIPAPLKTSRIVINEENNTEFDIPPAYMEEISGLKQELKKKEQEYQETRISLENTEIEKISHQNEIQHLKEEFIILQKEYEQLTETFHRSHEVSQQNEDELKKSFEGKISQQETLIEELRQEIHKLKQDSSAFQLLQEKLTTKEQDETKSISETRKQFQQLQESMREKIGENNKMQDLLQRQSKEIDGLNSKYLELEKTNTDLKEKHENLTLEYACISNEKNDQDAAIAELQQIIDNLNNKLAEKDRLQSILQDQVVKLAGQNLKDIDHAINKNNLGTSVKAASAQPLVEEKVHQNIQENKELPTYSNKLNYSKKDFPPKANEVDLPLQENNSSWVEQKDEQGQTYYYNSATGESSWSVPANFNSNQPVIKGDWMQQFDEQGQQYWVNQITGESAWEIPDDGISNENNDEDDDYDGGLGKIAQGAAPSIFDTNASQYSATAGDYTIEL